MRFGLSPVDVQGDDRLLDPAPLREGFGPSYDALRLLFCVSASLGYRRVGAPAAIGQLRAHAVCRAALTLPVGRFGAGSSGSDVSHVLSFAARGCWCFAGCPRRLASAFLIYPSWGLGRRCWFVRSLSFRFRFCRQIPGAGPCGLFILLGESC